MAVSHSCLALGRRLRTRSASPCGCGARPAPLAFYAPGRCMSREARVACVACGSRWLLRP
eukprot:6064215-Pleurochrysis_carterae.AAC.3